jgi:hypothetical protein
MSTSRKTHRGSRLIAAGILALLPTVAAGQDTTGAGAASGTVVSASGTPVLAVTVCLSGTTRCVLTDDGGRFRITDVRPGAYSVELTPPGGSRVITGTVGVRAGLDTQVALSLPASNALQERITITASAFVAAEEVKTSGYLIQRRELQASAGALQDVSRYVQALPGVALGADDFRNDLVVRGGSPLENLFIVDNIEIPNINAFANFSSAGGTVGLVDSALVEDVTFLSGGYPAAYGNRVSSVLQITQREGDRTRVRGRATLGFAGAGAVVEGPLAGGRGSWILSLRRSFLDFFTSDIGVGGVPVVYTLNAKVVMDLTPRDRVWAATVSGKDRIRLGLTDDSDLDQPLADFDIRYRGWRSATGINWQHLWSRGVGLLGVTHAVAAVNSQVKDLLQGGVPSPGSTAEETVAAGNVVFQEGSRETETTVKYDLTTSLPGRVKLQTGGAVKVFGLDYDTSAPLGTASPFGGEAGLNPFALQRAFRTHQFGAYAQASADLGGRVGITWGARADRFDYLHQTRVGPRLGVSVRLTDRVTWRASTGRYFQQPPFLFLAAFPQNARLEPLRADHLVSGFSFQASARTRFSIEAYHKRYARYPVSTDFPALSLANVGDTFNTREVLFPMSAEGRGEATGLELLIEKKPGGRWYGLANISFSRARHAGRDGILRPGSYDSPLIANLDGGVQWPGDWLLTARLTWIGGRPFTPFDEVASIAAGRGIFDRTSINGQRAKDYFRLDLRMERTFTVGAGQVTLSGGVQNVTNRRNFAGYYWSRRTDSVQVQDQMGIFPVVGMDWRF